METKIQRWGNSLGLRIPKSFAVEARVEAGSTVDLAIENGELIVRPVHRPKYDLSSLLKRVNPRNLHDAVDTGEPAGRESW
ncbi:MAG: AbrB/MazE/SpoVT family DNA-binding domain-containing protein [Actinomycetota bacterium]